MRSAFVLAVALTVSGFSPAAPVRKDDPYTNCLTRNVSLVDDGRMDATLVAKIVARRCKSAYRKSMAATLRIAVPKGEIVEFIPNFRAALIAVRKERQEKPAPNSN